MKPIKSLKEGEYFKRNATSKTVYCRGQYMRESKRYAAQRFDDICMFIYLKPDTLVHVDFEF
jgi:hypothetical protein